MKKILLLLTLLLLCFSTCDIGGFGRNIQFIIPEGEIQVVFSVTSDMREYTGCSANYFRGVCETIASGGAGEFMISPGDIDPPWKVYDAIQLYIGKNYVWYPVVGNHDKASWSYMSWLRTNNAGGVSLPNIVNAGPPDCEETTYSFDYGDAHFVVLNEYYNGISDRGTDGDVVDALYSWLIDDLSTNTKPVIFVFGHEPAFPRPDEENGRMRHAGDSLNAYLSNRDRFWNALVNYGVTAYFCGHTHNYSAVEIDGVWQIDAGHARGTADTGARSTFIMLYVMGNGNVWFYAYRLDFDTDVYVLTGNGRLRQL